MKKFLFLSILSIVATSGVISFSAKEYDGGEWTYGSSATSVWSNYFHDSVTHYAAIDEQGGNNTCTDDSAGAGHSARASQGQNPLTDQIARAGHGNRYC